MMDTSHEEDLTSATCPRLEQTGYAARRSAQAPNVASSAYGLKQVKLEQAKPLLCIGRGWTIYAGPIQHNRPHSHHLVQIAWSPVAAFELIAGTYRSQAAGHVVDAGAPHFLQSVSPVRLLFLDPAIPIARDWRTFSGGNARELAGTHVRELEARLRHWSSAKAEDVRHAPASEAREEALMDWLKANVGQPLRASDAARVVGLSDGRFLHWFTQAHELPFRPYVRWLRLQEVLRRLAQGANLTEAAHASGFSDSAHLSRTFVASFGITPRSLQRVKIVVSQSAGLNLAGVLPS